MKKFIIALIGLLLTASLYSQISEKKFNAEFGKILKEKKLNSLINEFNTRFSADQMTLILTAKNVGNLGADVHQLSEEKLEILLEELKEAHERKIDLMTKLYGSPSKINMSDLKQRITNYFTAYSMNPTQCEIGCWGAYFGCFAACESYACQYACEVRRINCIYACNNPS